MSFIEQLQKQIQDQSEKFHTAQQKKEERYTDQEMQAHTKAYELMAIISAGSFAVIASLSSTEPSVLMKIAMAAMLLTVVQVVFVFVTKARILSYLKDIGEIQASKACARTVKSFLILKLFTLITFSISNIALLLSVFL